MFTLAAFIQSVNNAGVYTQIAAAADPILTVTGNKILCPAPNNIVLAAGGYDSTVAQPRGRIVSPSLLTLDRFQVRPGSILAGSPVLPTSPTKVADLRSDPLPLVVGEQMTFEILSTPGAAHIQWGLIWLADGAIKPVNAKTYTVRAASATPAVAITWSNVAIVFDDALPRGRYQVVGLRGESASMIACRLLIPGQFWRPGSIGMQTSTDVDTDSIFRYGNMGIYGEFEDTSQPTMDVLCGLADATQEFFLDLVQVRAGAGGP